MPLFVKANEKSWINFDTISRIDIVPIKRKEGYEIRMLSSGGLMTTFDTTLPNNLTVDKLNSILLGLSKEAKEVDHLPPKKIYKNKKSIEKG